MNDERLTVANTILAQLGGRKFQVMTGARRFVGDANSLCFSLPGGGGFARNGINRVRVELNGSDLYDVTYYRTRGTKITTVAESPNIYGDMLREDFTRATGLETSMGTMAAVGKRG